MKLEEMTDREILVHLTHKVHYLEKLLDNHLRTSRGNTVAFIGVTGSLIVALLVVMLS